MLSDTSGFFGGISRDASFDFGVHHSETHPASGLPGLAVLDVVAEVLAEGLVAADGVAAQVVVAAEVALAEAVVARAGGVQRALRVALVLLDRDHHAAERDLEHIFDSLQSKKLFDTM